MKRNHTFKKIEECAGWVNFNRIVDREEGEEKKLQGDRKTITRLLTGKVRFPYDSW